MADTFNIEKLHRHFEDGETISIDELHQFYKKEEPDLPRSTLRWRVHELMNQEILSRVKRGVYKLGKGSKPWRPQLLPDEKKIYAEIKKNYPYLTSCIWSTQWLLNLTHHMPVSNFTIIDTERDTEESVFYHLQDTFSNYAVYLKPSRNEIEKYLGSEEKSIVVGSLISQSPLLNVDGVQTPTLEKIMVDLVADNVLFGAYQGKELQTIYENILDLYTVNRSKLRRYSQRRNRWDKVKSHLEKSLNKATDIKL